MNFFLQFFTYKAYIENHDVEGSGEFFLSCQGLQRNYHTLIIDIALRHTSLCSFDKPVTTSRMLHCIMTN